MLTETHITEDILDKEIEITGYKHVRCNSNSRHTGGVIMYVNENAQFKLIKSNSISKTWYLTISIENGIMNGNYSVVYKSPKEKINTFLEIIDQILDESVNYEKRNVILGDMNIDLKRNSKNAKKYKEVINQHNLIQIIDKPTRVNKKSSTIIDHAITNDENIQWQIEEETVSDHKMIRILCSGSLKFKDIVCEQKRTSWKRYSRDAMINQVDAINWIKSGDVENDFNVIYDKIRLSVYSLTDSVEIRRRNARWYSPNLQSMRNENKRLKSIYEISGLESDRLKLREASRKYKCAIRKEKESHVQNQFTMHRNDPKKLWKTLKGLYESKSNDIKSIEINGVKFTRPDQIANELNKSFVKSIDKIVALIPKPTNYDYIDKIAVVNDTFEIKPIDAVSLRRIALSLVKKSYDDNVSGRVINDILTCDVIASRICELINESIVKGIMPSSLKESIVTPIPKTSSPETAEEYRPVNNMSVIEKIFEEIVAEQMKEYVERNNIICPQQSGFRKFHSTETAVQVVLHEWITAVEEDKKILIVALDFKRAFETVNRDVLLMKLQRYGFTEKTLKWFRSYLSDRYQRTKVNGTISEPVEVNHGLPQGSKLSNLLFVLFINDLPINVPCVDINLFADDSLLYVRSNNLKFATEAMKFALDSVDDWLRFNSMALNVKKCKMMLINGRNTESPKIEMNGEVIEHVNNIKYLGVHIDEKLSFECHYEKLKAKLMSRVGLLRRLSSKMTNESRIVFLKSIILPHYDYCSSILMMLGRGKLDSIQTCINKAMRAALRLPYGTRATGMRETLKILKVQERLKLNAIKLINKTLMRGLPLSLFSKFKRRNELRPRELRNDMELSLPPWKSQRGSIFYEGVKLYNKCKELFALDQNFYNNCKNYIKSLN